MCGSLENISTEGNHRLAQAEQVEFLLMRMDLLQPEDRTLLELHLDHNVSFRKLALVAGVSAKVIASHLSNLTKRLLADEYINIRRQKEAFSKEELAVAYDRYLLGLSYRAISSKRNLSVKRTQRIIKRLEEWLCQEKEKSRSLVS